MIASTDTTVFLSAAKDLFHANLGDVEALRFAQGDGWVEAK